MTDSTSPKVYVVQSTTLNLSKATRFGELISILPQRANITMSPAPVLRELRAKLKDFNDSDYLLPLGDPVAIALAAFVAADMNVGRVKLLKWDRELNDYYVVKADFYDSGSREIRE